MTTPQGVRQTLKNILNYCNEHGIQKVKDYISKKDEAKDQEIERQVEQEQSNKNE